MNNFSEGSQEPSNSGSANSNTNRNTQDHNQYPHQSQHAPLPVNIAAPFGPAHVSVSEVSWDPGPLPGTGSPGPERPASRGFLPGGPLRKHPAEMPLVWSGLGLLITFVLAGLLMLIVEINKVDPEIGRRDPTEAKDVEWWWQVLGLPVTHVNEIFIIFLVFCVVIYFARGLLYAQQRASGVRITPEQFPQAFDIFVQIAQDFGLDNLPDAYMINGQGQTNAFASGHGRRRYIVFYSELFEIGGRLKDPETFKFIAAHEIGHIAAGHTGYFRMLLIAVVGNIPIFGSALSRAQEYSADNYGYSYTPPGSRGMTVLAAGRYMYLTTDFDQIADRATTEKGFFLWLYNLFASHPILIKRFQALRNRVTPGELF